MVLNPLMTLSLFLSISLITLNIIDLSVHLDIFCLPPLNICFLRAGASSASLWLKLQQGECLAHSLFLKIFGWLNKIIVFIFKSRKCLEHCTLF